MPAAPTRPRVLVVDDEALNRTLCARILAATCDVVEAVDGPAALEAVKLAPVDLVLLDVMMPGMSGFEVCPLLKAGATGYLPVLFLTSLHDQERRNEALTSGGDDFISKPFDRRELLLRVAAFLRIRQQDAVIREQVAHLQELQALKDDLVSLLVHDLRNPLASIIAFLEIERDELPKDTPAARLEDFTQVTRAASRMRAALEEALRIRSLEAGALEANKRPTQLLDAVREAVGTASVAAREKGLDVQLLPSEDPTLDLDRGLVVRSVENLLTNALKYSPRGGAVEVTVRSDPGQVHVEVADRGPGIPDELKQHVFEKFASVEGRRKHEKRGFGLGLYLVNLTMAAHGGSARVRDREGGGSIFSLTLPGPVT